MGFMYKKIQKFRRTKLLLDIRNWKRSMRSFAEIDKYSYSNIGRNRVKNYLQRDK